MSGMLRNERDQLRDLWQAYCWGFGCGLVAALIFALCVL